MRRPGEVDDLCVIRTSSIYVYIEKRRRRRKIFSTVNKHIIRKEDTYLAPFICASFTFFSFALNLLTDKRVLLSPISLCFVGCRRFQLFFLISAGMK